MTDQPNTGNNAPANTDPTSPTSTAGNPNSMRVHFDPEVGAQVEYLRTEGSTAVRNTADIALPTAEHFIAELDAHKAAIGDLQARLGEQDFDRSGKVKGFRISDPTERRNLELQMASRQNALNYTTQRLVAAHTTAQARADRRAKALEQGQPDPEANNNLTEAAHREAAITELAEQRINGVPMGRVRAAEIVDEEIARARASALVRRGR